MIEEFSDWLAGTEASRIIQDVTWIIPLTQTIHILCICIVMFAIGVLNLRLMGVAYRNQSLSSMYGHFMPWIWSSLVVLFLTGAVLTVGEPARELMNDTFRFKMILVVCAALLTWFVSRKTHKDAHFWDVSAGRRWAGRGIALVSLAVWVTIVAAGRLIAYMDTSQMY